MRKTGFSLIELMIVIVIVSILAVVAVPILRGWADTAKWSEAKAAMGSIATSLRCYAARNGESGTYPPSLTTLGFVEDDLKGGHFVIDDYSITEATFTEDAEPELSFIIQCDKASLTPIRMTLDHAGNWTAVDP